MRKRTNYTDEAIRNLTEERNKYAPGSDARRAIDSELTVLYAQRNNERRAGREWVAPVIASVIGLAQVGLILYKEEAACITSKALNFVFKPKL